MGGDVEHRMRDLGALGGALWMGTLRPGEDNTLVLPFSGQWFPPGSSGSQVDPVSFGEGRQEGSGESLHSV